MTGIVGDEPDETVGARVGQRFEQDGVERAEDRGIGADAQAQRDEHQGGERRRLGERPDRISEVLRGRRAQRLARGPLVSQGWLPVAQEHRDDRAPVPQGRAAPRARRPRGVFLEQIAADGVPLGPRRHHAPEHPQREARRRHGRSLRTCSRPRHMRCRVRCDATDGVHAARRDGIRAAGQGVPLGPAGRDLPAQQPLALEAVEGRIERAARHAPAGVLFQLARDGRAAGGARFRRGRRAGPPAAPAVRTLRDRRGRS